MQRHDIHGAHGQAGAIDHATDVAVQGDIVQLPLGCVSFTCIILGGIVHFAQFSLAVQGIAIHADFGVQAVQVSLRR